MDAEPLSLIAGDSATWSRQCTDYPASDGWAMTWHLVVLGYSASTPTVVGSIGSGDTYTVTLPAATTEGITPGDYRWVAVATKGSERHTVASGTLTVKHDPLTGDQDPRTHAEKCLAAVTAALEKRMGDPMLEYEIDGIKAKKIPHQELQRLRAVYADQVRRQRGGAFMRSYYV